MVSRLISFAICVSVIAVSCTAPRQSSAGNNRASSSSKQVVNKTPTFLEDISMTPESSTTKVNSGNRENNRRSKSYYPNSSTVEQASQLQLKYAVLLDVDVEDVRNEALYEFIDEWYGTLYCMGGTTKSCIDCSGFVQAFYSSVYGISIPRTAKDQYHASSKVSHSKLQEGDLLFYNTRGGVSHVGIYLQNNKFVHASTSGGVMISDMEETYYAKHFISAGRIDREGLAKSQ